MSPYQLAGRIAAGVFVGSSLLPVTAFGESVAEADPNVIEEVLVIAHPLSGEGLAQAKTVLEGQTLKQNISASVGETLARQPGISSASFGQAVGRPVIHGLGGARVRVMEDRIDTMDVSVTSADHATTVEPFIADRVEVLKGPSTLLYGNGAIGGIVDVHTGRVPHRVPDGVEGRAEVRGADNADERSAAGKVGVGAGNFALHLDGYYREADEYEIPGFAESEALRELEEAEGGGEGEEEEEAFGILPGSDLEARGGAIGGSYVGERGFAGLSVSTYRSEYGIPGGHEHEHEEGEEAAEEEEGNPFIDLKQTRVDFEGALADPWSGATSLNFRLGYNDYEHAEIEPNGEVATLFENEAIDARLELSHEAVGGFIGTGGLQWSDRDFSAEGEESYVPPVKTDTLGVFWVGERPFGTGELEAGVRYEHVEHDPDATQTDSPARDFDLIAVSLGLVMPFAERWTFAAVADYATRAPIAEELYSDGAHLATRAYEIGDPTLEEERATNLSATLGYAGERFTLDVTAYYNDFKDFIYERAAGEIEDDLPVFQWSQANAEFYGIDLSASFVAVEFDEGDLGFRATYDEVRGRLKDGDNRNLPRIPPRRFGLGAALNWSAITTSIDYLWVAKQDRVADFELPTESYGDLRIYLGADFPLGERELEVFLVGKNLTDEEQRYHTSFIKDFAPQPGRTVEGGLRLSF
jgi:iron complex outermembrane receptor protein